MRTRSPTALCFCLPSAASGVLRSIPSAPRRGRYVIDHTTHTLALRAHVPRTNHAHTHTSLSILAGYVTGLEPATGYATTRAVERKYGRVPTLGPGESRTFHLEYEVLSARPPAISLFSLPSLHTRTQHLSSALHTLLCLMPRSALLLTLLCLLCSVGFNSLS